MKIYPNQLTQTLKNHPTPVFMIAGDEPFLAEEAVREIITHFKTLGFSEKIIFHSDTTESPDKVREELSSLDLFTNKKILDVRLKTKPNKTWQQFLSTELNTLSDETILIVQSPKLEQSSFKTKWFKSFEKLATVVTVYPIKAENFHSWIKGRAQKYNLKLDDTAIALIATHTEGHLLATDQTLQKLTLSDDTSVENIQAMLAHDTRFDSFALTEAAFQGDHERAAKILASLKQEGTEPTAITQAFYYEIKKFLTIFEARRAGEPLKAIYQRERIWPAKQAIIERYFKNAKAKYLYEALQSLKRIDETNKGLQRGDAWVMLLSLCLTLNGVKTCLAS